MADQQDELPTVSTDEANSGDYSAAPPPQTISADEANSGDYSATPPARVISAADANSGDYSATPPEKTGILGAIPSGIAAGFKSLAGGAQLLGGQDVAQEAPEQFTGEAAQITHGIFKSIPALIAGLGAGSAGTLVSGPGGLASGSLGYGAISGIQDLYDEYQSGLQKFDGDKDKAFTEAMKTASITAGGSTVSWAAFPIKAAAPILMHIFTQAGLQGGIGTAEQAGKNIARGDDVTEGILAAGAQNAALTGILMAGHAGVGAIGRGLKARGEAAAGDAAAQEAQAADERQTGAPATGYNPDLPEEYSGMRGEEEPLPGHEMTDEEYGAANPEEKMMQAAREKAATERTAALLNPKPDYDPSGTVTIGGNKSDPSFDSPGQRVPIASDAAGVAVDHPQPPGGPRPTVTAPKDNAVPTTSLMSEGVTDPTLAAALDQSPMMAAAREKAATERSTSLLNPKPDTTVPFDPNDPASYANTRPGEQPDMMQAAREKAATEQTAKLLNPQPDYPPAAYDPNNPATFAHPPAEGEPAPTDTMMAAAKEKADTARTAALLNPKPEYGQVPFDLNDPASYSSTFQKPQTPETAPEPPAGPPAATQAAIASSQAPKAPLSLRNNLLGRIISPNTVTPLARQMDLMMRKFIGIQGQAKQAFYSAMEPFRPILNAAPEQDKINAMIGANTGNLNMVRPDLRELVTGWWANYKAVENDLKTLNGMEQQEFLQKSFPQYWKNKEAADEFTAQWFEKQGSASSMHHRAYPTIPDGLKAGLELDTNDMIEGGARYTESMRDFIATSQIRDQSIMQGMMKYVESTGGGAASGHPEPPTSVPPGWDPILGRAGRPDGQLYAPKEVAALYNNHISSPWKGNAEAQTIANAAQRISNATTGLLFGFNMFHGVTITNESFLYDLGLGASKLFTDPKAALSKIAQSPLAPYHRYQQGKLGQQWYLNPESSPPEIQAVMKALTEANAPIIKNPDPSYKFTAKSTLATAYQRGSLGSEFKDAINNVMEQQGLAGQALQAGKEVMSGLGRVVQTIASPLFDYYIPRVKTGASMEAMKTWMGAHPDATYPQISEMAARIGDASDNVMGEMNYDNIHWNKTFKQLAQTFIYAPSWFLGTVRALGGGTKSLLQGRMNPAGKNWDPNASYALGFYIGIPLINSAYQYIKTGLVPTQSLDVMFPQTGGTLPSGQPERALLPGYQKEIVGWYNSPTKEVYAKLSAPVKLVVEALMNEDWRNKVIYDKRENPLTQVAQFAQHALTNMSPISLKNMYTPPVRGSNLTLIDRFFALRTAPPQEADKARYDAQQRKYQTRDWRAKTNAENRDIARRQ